MKITALDGLLLAGFVLLAFQLLGPALTIPLHIPLNYNEGWNAILDARAVGPGAGPLYPPPDSFVFNNYPPLGFYLVGGLGRYVFGDMIVAGRVVALVSLLGAAALAGLCVRHLGGGPRAALATGLLIPLYVSCFFRKYVAVDDPQWLAHAIMLCGLAVVLGGGGTRRLAAGEVPVARLACAALLMVAGGFVKHNLVALPVAVTLWLACLNRSAALAWIAVAATGLGLGLVVTEALHGHTAFADILHHRRVFRAGLMKHSLDALAPLLPMAILAVLLPRLAPRRDSAGRAATLLLALYGGIALVTGIVQRTGEGVYYNAHFETLIAASLGFGVALSRVIDRPLRWRGAALRPASLGCFAALPVICAQPWHLPRAWADIHDRAARAASWQPMISRIAATEGPAGCLMISLCWWAGKPSGIDMFNLTQESELARSAPPAFQAAVANGYFAIFEDDPRSFTHNDARSRLGYDPVMSLFAGRYEPVGHGPEGTVLLAPVRPEK